MKKLISTMALVLMFSIAANADTDTSSLPKRFYISCVDGADPSLMVFQFVRYPTRTGGGGEIQEEYVGLYHKGIGLRHIEQRSDHNVITNSRKEKDPTVSSSTTSIYFSIFDSFKNESERDTYNVGVHFNRLISSIKDFERFKVQISIFQHALTENAQEVYAAELDCLRHIQKP